MHLLQNWYWYLGGEVELREVHGVDLSLARASPVIGFLYQERFSDGDHCGPGLAGFPE